MRRITLAALLMGLAACPAHAATYDEIYNQQRMESLQNQQLSDEHQYQMDQMRQQTRDNQTDFDLYQMRQDSLTRHYRSLSDPD